VTPKPVLYGSIAARIAGVPSIVNAISGLGHAFVGNSAQALTMRAAASLLYRMAFRHPNAHIIFQNPSDRALLQRLVPTVADRNTLIPGSGVSLEAFTPSPFPAETLTVILAARLLRNKGIYEFVEAARRLRANAGLDVRMVLVGMPDPGNPTTVSDKDLHLWSEEGVIEWWGHQADMAEVLSRAHIFCLPSHGGEGVPKVILEAMASGRPVITTDVPGCRDAVEDGKTGLLIPPRDGASLATAITMLASDSQRRVALGAAGRQRAEALFSVDSVVEQHLAIYERLQLSLF
jgi:glycosyltransferase involved in cell wall biosynthesis